MVFKNGLYNDCNMQSDMLRMSLFEKRSIVLAALSGQIITPPYGPWEETKSHEPSTARKGGGGDPALMAA
jgi:hypothetical protein